VCEVRLGEGICLEKGKANAVKNSRRGVSRSEGEGGRGKEQKFVFYSCEPVRETGFWRGRRGGGEGEGLGAGEQASN
jgi:hypothetical protein